MTYDTQFIETKVLLMVLEGVPSEEITRYMEENFTPHALGEYLVALDKLCHITAKIIRSHANNKERMI